MTFTYCFRMRRFKYLLALFCLSLVVAPFVSCDDDDEETAAYLVVENLLLSVTSSIRQYIAILIRLVLHQGHSAGFQAAWTA